MAENVREKGFEWLLCPTCGSMPRIKMRVDTDLKNFPLFCPKCRHEILINVNNFIVSVIKEPDA